MADTDPLSVRINGTELQAQDELHRRKLQALAQFVNALLAAPAGKHIAKMVLYGSVARGEAEADSDVDLLVFAVEGLSSLEQTATALAWDLSLREGERVSALVLPLNTLYYPTDFFFTSSRRDGTEIYAMNESELRRTTARNNLWLALEYLRAAEVARASGIVRAAIDTAYNAAELAAKAFLVLEAESLPTRHGRIIGLFGEVFIVKKQLIPPELGRGLHILLDRRHKARYVWEAELTDEMAESAVGLARDLVERLRNYLAETIPSTAEESDEHNDNP